MTIRGLLARDLTALVLGASGGIVIGSGAAFASACREGTGVTVVVNDAIGCDSSAAGTAAVNFTNAGHRLTFVRTGSSAGFVCRIDGRPANDPCRGAAPSDAYWASFWSDGRSGTWNYSSVGVGGLEVPKGGWVAFVFQTSADRTPPSIAPTAGSSVTQGARSRAREKALGETASTSESSSTASWWVGGLLAVALAGGIGLTTWQRRTRVRGDVRS